MDKSKEKANKGSIPLVSGKSSQEKTKVFQETVTSTKNNKGTTNFWSSRDIEAKRRGLHKLNLKKLEMLNEYVLYSANKPGGDFRSYKEDFPGVIATGGTTTNKRATNLLIETKDLQKKSMPYTPVGILTPFKSTAKNTDTKVSQFPLSPNVMSTTTSNKTFLGFSNKFTNR